MNLRHCHHCGERKPAEAFGVEPLYCRACVAEYHRERRAKYRRLQELAELPKEIARARSKTRESANS